MNPGHHPGEETLLAHAVGTLAAGGSLTVGLHLEVCSHCRATMRFLDTLGGLVMTSLKPEPLRPGATERALSSLGAQPQDPPQPGDRVTRSDIFQGLRHGPWQIVGPGLEVAAVEGDFNPDETVCVLRAKAGASFPHHGHAGVERFVILEGGFGIGDTVYVPRDYYEGDSSVAHAPYIPTDLDCLCVLALEGGLIFTNPDERLAGL